MCLTEGCPYKAHDKRGKCPKCLGYNHTRKKCKTEGCNKQAFANGLCRGCGAPAKVCTTEGCTNNSQKYGICFKCGAVPIKCKTEGCTNKALKNGVCRKCGAPPIKCKTEGCNNNSAKDGLCYSCHPDSKPITKCPHGKQKCYCQICDPIGHLAGVTRSRVWNALKENKTEHTVEYLGCTTAFHREHITKQLKEGMTWENYGKVWHIDHIRPIKFENPTIEQAKKRLHYTNTQPIGKEENLKKGNRYVG